MSYGKTSFLSLFLKSFESLFLQYCLEYTLGNETRKSNHQLLYFLKKELNETFMEIHQEKKICLGLSFYFIENVFPEKPPFIKSLRFTVQDTQYSLLIIGFFYLLLEIENVGLFGISGARENILTCAY